MNERKYRHRGYQDKGPPSSGGGRGPGSDGAPTRLEGVPRGRGADRNRDEVFRCKACGEKGDPEPAPGARCRRCGGALRACVQCRSFDSAARFQCRQPITAPVTSKSDENACPLFEASVVLDLTGHKASETPDTARSAFDKLFGKR